MQSGINNIKIPRKLLYLGVIMLVIILLVGLITSISNLLSDSGEISPEFLMPTVIERINNISVERRVRRISCLSEGRVNYAIIDLFLEGGTLPYTYFVENSLSESEGPFMIEEKDEAITILVKGGKTVSVQIWSANSRDPDWVGTISISDKDPYCNEEQNMNTATLTNMPTYTATPTQTITLTPTGTLYTLTPTFTLTYTPTYTSTPFFMPSPTLMFTPTSTFTLTPTNTSTFTLTPTNTSTFTLTPTLTYTPTPITDTPTYTPTPSSQWECSDGIDNDGDGFIDANDPECTFSHDNHEDR